MPEENSVAPAANEQEMVKNVYTKFKPLVDKYGQQEGLSPEVRDIMTILISNESGGQLINPKTGVVNLRFEGHVFKNAVVNNKKNELIKQGVKEPEATQAAQRYLLGLMNSDKNKLFYNTVDEHPGTSGQAELDRLKRAYEIDPNAAAISTGLGLTGIQGINYKLFGYNSPKEFLDYVLATPREEDYIKWQAKILNNNIAYFRSKYNREPSAEEILSMYQAGPANPFAHTDPNNKVVRDYHEKYKRRKAYIGK